MLLATMLATVLLVTVPQKLLQMFYIHTHKILCSLYKSYYYFQIFYLTLGEAYIQTNTIIMIKPNREENLFKMKKQPLKLLYIASTILQ
jgi:hypothetical protein